MDVHGWKRILLQWVAECGFLERNYFSLEQTDIDEFYRNFCLSNKSATRLATINSLHEFVREFYPDFQLHLDDENSLSVNDYIYIYSMLLHFCCVKCPDSIFHEICKRLPGSSQRCIAAFFGELMDATTINRERLRQAITNVGAKHANQSNEGTSSCSSNSIGLPSTSYSRVESPGRHSRTASTNNSPRMVPATPKTALLEDRTRELYSLRALLETERYEKGLLEVQIKQYEEKIVKLNQDHRKLQQQIQDLKNDILTKNMDSNPTTCEVDDQVRRRLCKEITQKEGEIGRLNELLGTLREDKCLIQDKLEYAEKQIASCVERIKELTFKLDEMSAELEQKDLTIQSLKENKLELEQFIAESRASSHSRPDYLDASFSPITENSSPENLGRSVVDVQLREKEHENVQLRRELTDLQERCSGFLDRIREFIAKQSEEFDLKAVDFCEGDNNPQFFDCLLEYAKQLGQHYKDDKLKLITMQTDMQSKQQQNVVLNKKVGDLNCELAALRENMAKIEAANSELEKSKMRMDVKVVRCEEEIAHINATKQELTTQLETLYNDYEAHKKECEKQREEFTNDLKEADTKLRRRAEECTKLNEVKKKLKAEVDSLNKKLKLTQESLSVSSEEVKSLSDRYAERVADLEAHTEAGRALKEKYEKLLVQYEDLRRDKRETSNHLEIMRNNIAVKELEMCKLGAEIVELRQKNVELESRIDSLMIEYSNEKKRSENAIRIQEENLRAFKKQSEDLQEDLQTCRQELDERNKSLNMLQENFESLGKLLLDGSGGDLQESLSNIMVKAQELQEFKCKANNQIELLTLDKMEAVSRMRGVEEQLKHVEEAKQNLVCKYNEQLNTMQGEILCLNEKVRVYEAEIELLKADQAKQVDDLQSKAELQEEDFVKRLQQLKEEHEFTVRDLEKDLFNVNERLSVKCMELEIVTTECAEIKQKLKESADQLEELQCKHLTGTKEGTEKLQSLELKIEQLLNENEKFIADISAFKDEHKRVEQRLKQADDAINDLNNELQTETAGRAEVTSKLAASERRLAEVEVRLEQSMKETALTIRDLNESLLVAEYQIELLEKDKDDQSEMITRLRQNIEQISEEKKRLSKDVAEFATQVQSEQKEKATLLRSLEQTADQLAVAISEKEKSSSLVDQRSEQLEIKLQEAERESVRLQNELRSQEEQLRHLREEHERDRDNWQTRLSDLVRRVTEESENMEAHQMSVAELTAVIENNCLFSALPSAEENQYENIEIENVFGIEESELNTSIGRLKLALNRLLCGLAQVHTQLYQAEQKRQGAVEVLEKANDKLNEQLLARKSEITELQLQLANERKQGIEMSRFRSDLEEQRSSNSQLQSQIHELQRACDAAKQQHTAAIGLVERLELEKLEIKTELQRANENVTRLIQGAESIRQEKEGLVEEMQQLRKQLEQMSDYQSTAEEKMMILTANAASFERQLEASEAELQELRTQVEESQRKKEEMLKENEKLLDSQEASKTRIEKLALKLGDTQARYAKLENDNHKLNESLVSIKTNVDRLQREKSHLENEKQKLHERLGGLERNQLELKAKVQLLEQTNAALVGERKALEASELDAKTKLTKLEKIRQTNEEKLRKLNNALETSESLNVRLNHEIGAINSELNELRIAAGAERATTDQLEATTQQRDAALAYAKEHEELVQKLQTETSELQERNTDISDKLSKVTLALQIAQQRVDTLAQQLGDLEIDMTKLRDEKQQVECEHKQTCAKLQEYELQNQQLLVEQRERIAALESQVGLLKQELQLKTEEIETLHQERKGLREGASVETAELEQLRIRLQAAEAMTEAERKSSTQLRLDNQILQAKYRESKQRLLEETKASEERIKENRLEMEGKLDKMKNKMKTLYTEEITKMKSKQEREMANLKTDMEQLQSQNTKYEEHVRKLSSQIVRLNERILEHQKQNAIISTKLRHMQSSDTGPFRRPSNTQISAHSALPTATSTTTLTSAPGNNFAMEDEEGEVFNNTYLTDLKTGRMSMGRDICAEELQYRNSLLPPHLKSAYAAQYDHCLAEDELKDGPHSLDDSMIGLLSTTSSSTRARKLTGMTNYKRPGPPTPSKHGGRLSLGGCAEPPREILKETNDGGSGGNSGAKTPVRFGFFASRFSMGNSVVKDENTPPKRRLSNMFKKHK